MGRPVLLLRLEGPLQAWGTRARWDVRDTGHEPTKSGIVGLLGCAFGYPVGDPRLEHELDAGLRMGVRVEHPGAILEDYQTITDFLPTADGRYKHSGVKTATSLAKLRRDSDATPSTIISPRRYLEDAAFLVALEETDAAPFGLLTRCATALQQPRWPLFLGRKACVPTRPIWEMLTDAYADMADALTHYPWSWLGACMDEREGPPNSVDAYLEDATGTYVRQDAVRSNAARQYGFRRVRRYTIQPHRSSQEDTP